MDVVYCTAVNCESRSQNCHLTVVDRRNSRFPVGTDSPLAQKGLCHTLLLHWSVGVSIIALAPAVYCCSLLSASQLWVGNSLAVNQCQRRLALFTAFWRNAVQAPGLAVRWNPSVGEGARAGTRARREGRSEERVPQFCLSGTGSDSGGAWSGWTPSVRHLLRIETRGRRGMLLGGALRGRSPRTREGRIGPTAQNCSGQWLVVSGQRRRFA